MAFLLDANVLIDIFTRDPAWADWSAKALYQASLKGTVLINPIIYAEVSIAFSSQEVLDNALTRLNIERCPIPYPAAFLAGKVFLEYRRKGGIKTSPLPDFLIGAHAFHEKLTLITRDPKPYRTYFPEVKKIAP